MSISFYEWVAGLQGGERSLAEARLKYDLLRCLNAAQLASGKTDADLAIELGVSPAEISHVLDGDGDLQVSTAADYFHAMGFELGLELYDVGEQRKARVDSRDPRPVALAPQTLEGLGRQHGQQSSSTGTGASEELTPIPSGQGKWSIRERIRPATAAFKAMMSGVEGDPGKFEPGQQHG
ncbi:hypothetical protein FRACA_2610009 [Frankia canadensis]|uniref:Uncharacterized protein n=1 Tax=Frankia canadensis TaxID=1836972 RepID=A0A2I2KSH0_9ACTN|nr:hypothetical protein [Frankia canadensis]SNQ48623.1 hypothetical protein FRACA_2610009 [Frankia canadensis]SOU55913.1 hypothetical protein FRACA_2610009 [Frankia canadensis]